jgi:hypothetical protein
MSRHLISVAALFLLLPLPIGERSASQAARRSRNANELTGSRSLCPFLGI